MDSKMVLRLCAFALLTNLQLSLAEDTPQEFEASVKANADLIKKLQTENATSWSPDLDTWEAPLEMRKELPYYFAGYDYEKRPVFISEYGKWDGRKYIDGGEESAKLYDKYCEQHWWRLNNLKSEFPDAEDGVIWISDMTGFTLKQVASVEIIKNQLIQSRRMELIQDNIAEFILINMSFIAETWLNLLRPIAGKLVGRADAYGQKSEKWIPVLAGKIPKESLPAWYGGSKDFKPIKVYSA